LSGNRFGKSFWFLPHFSADPSPSGLVASVERRDLIGNLAGTLIMNAEKMHGPAIRHHAAWQN
jgi:hypothetical protein